MVRYAARFILAAWVAFVPLRATAQDAGLKPAPTSASAATKPTTKIPTTATATKTAKTPSKTPPKTATNTATKTATKTKKAQKNAPIQMFHVNRHETMALQLRDKQGRPVKGVQRRFNRFLRCHYTGVQHAMHPRLIRLIYQTGRNWPGRRVEVVSGFRNPKVAKNPRSPHMKGLACDFRVAGVTGAELRDYLRRTFDKVGVGYYPNSSFVHLDVRKDRSAFWIDYSGPGERAVYSENPDEDLRSGRAEQYHPTKIDESWANDTSDNPEAGNAETATP